MAGVRPFGRSVNATSGGRRIPRPCICSLSASMFEKEATMARDQSYDRGRAWRAGNEEEGGYGGSGMEGDDSVLHRPRYGRDPRGSSNGGVEYRSVPERDRRHDTDASNASYGGWEGNGGGASRQGSHAGRGPKNYRRSDERIAEEINEALTHN